MDRGICRETMGKLLADEGARLRELARLLEQEHELLLANDVVRLESAIRERQSCVGAIIRIDEERRSLCRLSGYGNDAKGLEQLLRWCDPQGTLTSRWADVAQLAGRCREFNDRNGALVSARLKRVQTLLGVLIGGGREGVTYGRGGGYALGTVGRVVA